MIELTDIDAEILKFIDTRDSVNMETLKKEFPNVSSMEYRIKLLSTPDYSHLANTTIRIPKSNTSYLSQDYETGINENGYSTVKYLGIYRLTMYGKKELQDYELQKSSHHKELLLKNAWMPIIVAFATTVITNYILPKLPQLIRWLSRILLGIFS